MMIVQFVIRVFVLFSACFFHLVAVGRQDAGLVDKKHVLVLKVLQNKRESSALERESMSATENARDTSPTHVAHQNGKRLYL